MPRNLDTGTLRTFIAVVEMAGVTRAANKLHLTQSAVSMQLKRLEETVGTTLLTRNSNGMVATTAGEQLLSYARRLVELNDETLNVLASGDDVAELGFGVSHDIVDLHIADILKQFAQLFPRTTVRLYCKHTANLLERFRAGKLDVIITTEPNAGPECKELLRRELVWTGAVNGVAWRQNPLPLAFTRICMFRKPAIAALDAAGIPWVNAVDSGNNLESGTVSCAADLAIRADIKGFKSSGMEEVNDTQGRLPPLPVYCINLYTASRVGAPNDRVAQEFGRLVEHTFATERAIAAPPLSRE
jgi:DNA-binding transcriptional LysR family regulator